jgi:hypothetical protein
LLLRQSQTHVGPLFARDAVDAREVGERPRHALVERSELLVVEQPQTVTLPRAHQQRDVAPQDRIGVEDRAQPGDRQMHQRRIHMRAVGEADRRIVEQTNEREHFERSRQAAPPASQRRAGSGAARPAGRRAPALCLPPRFPATATPSPVLPARIVGCGGNFPNEIVGPMTDCTRPPRYGVHAKWKDK